MHRRLPWRSRGHQSARRETASFENDWDLPCLGHARLINMVRSGVLDISQASITAFSLDDASEAVTRAADQSAPFDRTMVTSNRK